MMRSPFQRYRFLTLFTLIIVIILAGIAIIWLRPLEKSKSVLLDRLKTRSVPVKTLSLSWLQPYYATVILQSTSDTNEVTSDDQWNLQVTLHEINLGYRIGIPIKHYLIYVQNRFGNKIFVREADLDKFDLLRQEAPIYADELDDQKAVTVVNRMVSDIRNVKGVKNISIQVIGDGMDLVSSNLGQICIIRATVQDEVTAESLVYRFANLSLIDYSKLDPSYMRLALCRNEIVNQYGNILLDLASDGQGNLIYQTGLPVDWCDFIPCPAPVGNNQNNIADNYPTPVYITPTYPPPTETTIRPNLTTSTPTKYPPGYPTP